MFFLKPAVLALSMALMAAAPARAFDDTEKAAMIEAVETFNAAFAAGEFGVLFDYMPPLVLENIAAQAGMDTAALMDAMKAEIDAAMAVVTIESYTMDTDAATYATTPDGSRDYALIPTETVMAVEGAGRMRATSETLAFEDEGDWYLVRIDEAQQVQLLQAAYPEFTGIDFPPGAMVPLE